MTTHGSGAGTSGTTPPAGAPAPATPAGAPAPTVPGAPASPVAPAATAPATPATSATPAAAASASAPAAPAAPATSATAPAPAAPAPSLTADEVRAWLALQGVAAAEMDEPTVRGHVDSLDGCVSNVQLRNTLGFIRSIFNAIGGTDFNSAVTVTSLKADVAAMNPPAPAAPRPPSRIGRAFRAIGRGLLWIPGLLLWVLIKLGRLAALIGRGLASVGRAIGRRWKPVLAVAAGLAILAGLTFGGIKGYEWWQTRPAEVAQTPPAPTAPQPTVVAVPTTTASPQPVVVPGPTQPAVYYPALDLQCVMYGRLQACSLPPGCTEGFVTNPPRLQVTCPGGITYTDDKSMTEYPPNQRVSVHLRPGL